MFKRSQTLAALALSCSLAACGGEEAVAPPAVTPAAPVAPPAEAIAPPAEAPKPSPSEVYLAACREHLTAARALRGKTVAAGEHTVAAVLEPYNDLLIHLSTAGNLAQLYVEVSPEAAMREAADTCTREVTALGTELSLDRPLYDVLKAVDLSAADAETKRFVMLTLRDFQRAGVDKDEATRARLKVLSDQQTQLQLAIERNINEDVRKIVIDPAELDGLPADYIASHQPGADGKVIITTDYPDSVPFITYAKSDAARKKIYLEFFNRGFPKNEEVLHQLLAAREEQAKLLGFPNFAAYITADKMIKSAKNADEFVAKIAKVADGRMKKDLAALLAAKKKQFPKATVVNDWERAYYTELVRRDQFAFDGQSVRPYFDFAPTRDGLLLITGQLYGVSYTKIDDAPRWAPDVDVYDVIDKASSKKIGRIYLDLHPRENKFKHAACFPMITGVEGKQLPEAALVTNFPDPKVTGGPALMDHDDVETLFHEFGHLMAHLISGHQRWQYFSGSLVFDFVEAPSQMFEEWAWDPSTLGLFAKDVNSHQPIPAELVKKMRAASEFGKGITTRQQMFYADLSLRLHEHDAKTVDLLAETKASQKKYAPLAFVEGTHMYDGFGHLSDYSAMYYTYMWSEVIAKDLLSAFKKNGLLDPATAKRYRDTILVPGNAVDADDAVKNFLGRPYGFDSFKAWLDAG